MRSTDLIAEFITLAGKLKEIERFRGQYYWKDYPQRKRYDSVADHSWRVALLVIALEKQLSQSIDLGKCLTMALIHDLPEILSGDESPMGQDGTGQNTYAFNAERKAERHKKELAAAQEVFRLSPDDSGLLELWEEVEEGQSFEARLVRALDKLEALQQVFEYQQGHLFPEHLEFTITYALKQADVDPAVRAYGEAMADKIRANYTPFTK